MANATAAAGKTVLSPKDHTLILIDYQSQMAFATKSIDADLLRNNAALVAHAARVFEVSTTITSVAESDGRVQTVADRTTLPSYPADAATESDHLAALAQSLADAGTLARDAIEAANGWSDVDTADVLTQTSRELDQLLWLVEAHQSR